MDDVSGTYHVSEYLLSVELKCRNEGRIADRRSPLLLPRARDQRASLETEWVWREEPETLTTLGPQQELNFYPAI